LARPAYVFELRLDGRRPGRPRLRMAPCRLRRRRLPESAVRAGSRSRPSRWTRCWRAAWSRAAGPATSPCWCARPASRAGRLSWQRCRARLVQRAMTAAQFRKNPAFDLLRGRALAHRCAAPLRRSYGAAVALHGCMACYALGRKRFYAERPRVQTAAYKMSVTPGPARLGGGRHGVAG